MENKKLGTVPVEKIIRSCVISVLAVVAAYAMDYLNAVEASPEIVGIFAVAVGYLNSRQKEIKKLKAEQ